MTIAKIEMCENGNRETWKNHLAFIQFPAVLIVIRVCSLYLLQFQVKSKDSDIDVELYKKRKIKILF